MAAGLGLSLRTSQHLALTPQLQQSIRMLQLSSAELALEVSTMLAQNPCLLEDDEDDIDRVEVESLDDGFEAAELGLTGSSTETESIGDAPVEVEPTDWEGDGSVEMDTVNAEWADAGGDRAGSDDDSTRESSIAESASPSLVSHLLSQVASLRLGDLDGAVLYFVVHCINESGLLVESDEELACLAIDQGVADLLDVDFDDESSSLLVNVTSSARLARSLIQQLDPVGLGASSVLDCLQIQARHLARSASGEAAAHWGIVMRLLQRPLVELARHDSKKLAKACQCDESLIAPSLARLRMLDPHPGARFGGSDAGWVVPEVLVRRIGRSLKVEINPAAMPKLRVDGGFAGSSRGASRSAPIQQSLLEARWFIKNIKQRFDTILRVSEVIVDRQRRFFMHGATAMKPLVLREIADELGVHESTVSRVTSSKFMQTPAGTFELKYFFGSSLATASGGITSATAVRALIGQMIGAENPATPLSDSEIAKALASQGITCARRTVAKYRESMHIPVGSLRVK